MRLIGEFKEERQAFGFQTFLQKEGVNSVYDFAGGSYRLWVVEEDDFEKAYALYGEWQKNPQDPRYIVKEKPAVGAPVQHAQWKVRMEFTRPTSPFSMTNIIILLCAFFYLLSTFQADKIEREKGVISVEYGLTPIQKLFLFDYPVYLQNYEKFISDYSIRTSDDLKDLPPEGKECFKKLETAPEWKGFLELIISRSWKDYDALPAGTLFHDIRQGEVWRLFTPVLLHGGLLHILFNMAWLWILGKQVEKRIGIFRYLLLTLLLGVIGNVAQYLVSGPIFLGYSGIVVGLVGFIWMRQRMAPWEGYPLQRSVIGFITIFVLAMVAIELVSIGLQFFHVTELYANIANTAHIAGGVAGIVLARIPFFSRGKR